MKRFFVLLTTLSVIYVLSACSTDEVFLRLVDANADIISDESKVGYTMLSEGELAGKKLVPISLYYTFPIKNDGDKQIGNLTEGKALRVEIEPNEKLLIASNEVMGFNIFEPTEYEEMGSGSGHTTPAILGPSETGEFTIHFNLGFKEESEEMLTSPSKEQLDYLKANALDATLIVLLANVEIARFTLSENE